VAAPCRIFMPTCPEGMRAGQVARACWLRLRGSEAAFSRLWRDTTPALLRYLRVIAPQAAEDVACRDLAACGRRAVQYPRTRRPLVSGVSRGAAECRRDHEPCGVGRVGLFKPGADSQ